MTGPGRDPRREAAERVQAVVTGPKGDRGERGLSPVQGQAVVALFVIAVVLAAFAVFWVSHAVNKSQAEQARQGQVVERKLCSTLGSLAELKPPAGDPAANPARAYDQQLHAKLDQLGPDLGCR